MPLLATKYATQSDAACHTAAQNVTLVRVLLMPLQCRYTGEASLVLGGEQCLSSNLRNVYQSICVDYSRLPEGCVVRARERPRCHSAYELRQL